MQIDLKFISDTKSSFGRIGEGVINAYKRASQHLDPSRLLGAGPSGGDVAKFRPGQYTIKDFAGGDQITQFNAVIIQMADKIKDAGKEFEETNKKKHKMDKNLKKTTKTTEGFINKIVEMGGKLRSISRLFFYASLDMKQFANAVLGPIAQGMQIWLEYEKSLAKVFVNVSALGQDGAAAIRSLSNTIVDMAKSWEFSQAEIGQAAAMLGQARVSVEDIQASLGDLAGIARVTFSTMDSIAQIAYRIMKQFRVSLEDATNELWRMAAMSQETGESISNLVNSMGYATEVGQSLEFTFSEIAASMTLLTQRYGTASISGRRLSTVYSRLLEVGEEYGIQLRSTNAEMLDQRDVISNLADYLDLIGDPIEQNLYLMALFGRIGADAARTLINAFKQGDLDDVMEETGDNMIDTMKEVSKSMEELTYIGIGQLTSSMQDLKMTLARDVAPAIKDLAELLVPLISNTTSWIAANKEAVIGVAALAAGLWGLATVIQAVGFGIEIVVALATSIQWLGGAASALAAKLTILGTGSTTASVSLGGLVSGIGVALGALALIVTAIILAINFLKGFGEEADRLIKKNGALARSIGALQAAFQALAGVMGLIIPPILIMVVAGFQEGFKKAEEFGKIVAWLAEMFLLLVEGLDDFLGIGRTINKVIGKTQEIFESWLGTIIPHSPSLADRLFEIADATRSMVVPMQDATMWSRRLQGSMGDMKASAEFGISSAIGGAMGDGGKGGTTINKVSIDGAYIQDPEELVDVAMNRLMAQSKKVYRSGGY